MVVDSVLPTVLTPPQANPADNDNELNDIERIARRALSGRHERAVHGLAVRVDRGVLTLRGQVRSYYERQLLLHAVHRELELAGGRVGIVDELTVAAGIPN